MSLLRHPVFRGGVFVVTGLAWVLSLMVLAYLNVAWHDVVPGYENREVIGLWVFSGPAIPVAMISAGVLLGNGWEAFRRTSAGWAKTAAFGLPVMGGAYVLGFLLSPATASVIVMDIGLGLHVSSVVGIVGATILDRRAPWSAD